MATLKERIKTLEERTAREESRGVECVVVNMRPKEARKAFEKKECPNEKNQMKKKEKGKIFFVELSCEDCKEKCRFQGQPMGSLRED
jgi:hypothetical protein